MSFKTEVIEKIAVLMTIAFGLIAALAWNTSIQALFIQIFGEQENLPAMFGYAILVTIIAVLITIWIARISAQAMQEEKKAE